MEILTNSEKELMNFLWSQNGAAMTVNEILEKCKDRSWKDSYTYLLIPQLMKKGLIQVADYKRVGKVFARALSPVLSKEEYYIKILDENVGLPDAAEYIIKNTEDKELLQKWKKMIEEKESSDGLH